MELGIIGLPTSGKTTVFNALTRSDRPTTAAVAGKLELESAVVDVPDARVDRLSAMFKPRKTIYAKIMYTDIAGLDQGAAKTGLSGAVRNQIAKMDAFVHVVRTFESDRVPHPLGSVNPQRDLERLDAELLLADMTTVENRLERIAEGLKKGARAEERQLLQTQELLFQRLRVALEAGTPARDVELLPEEQETLSGFGLLTLKPVLVLLNAGDTPVDPAALLHYQHRHTAVLSFQGKLEMEIAQLPPEEAAVFLEEFGLTELGLSRVLRTSYDLLGVHSFFTVGEDEVRAWTIRRGATAVEAAGAIHTDLARGFIRAEVIAYDDLIAAGGMVAARKVGKVRLEGKEYLVQNGDIVHIRFSA
jgi:hypothetical protein